MTFGQETDSLTRQKQTDISPEIPLLIIAFFLSANVAHHWHFRKMIKSGTNIWSIALRLWKHGCALSAGCELICCIEFSGLKFELKASELSPREKKILFNAQLYPV